MSLFDQLVDEALRTRDDLAVLRPVVEKELLHHDILREMSEGGWLAGLRDLWDIAWLVQRGISLPQDLIPLKISDHRRTPEEFAILLRERTAAIHRDPQARVDFIKEMRRFLPVSTVQQVVESPSWWDYLNQVIQDQTKLALAAL